MVRKLLISFVVASAVLGGVFVFRHSINDALALALRGPIPPAVSYAQVQAGRFAAAPPAPANTNATRPTPKPALPDAVNLAVPFILQAPTQNWDDIHEDACEEASLSMINLFYKGAAGPLSKEEMEAAIFAAVAWENKNFGFNKDTSAEETAQVMRKLHGLNAKVVTVASIQDIKKTVAAGKPVIVPAYGKALKNPNFRQGGPLYHMLVIKGYKGSKIITNDPGTRRGADYVYDGALLWDAIHDWNGGDVPQGAKVMIVVE
ncbi:MAG: C39 family peptidase [Patescibacteria group bacterium]